MINVFELHCSLVYIQNSWKINIEFQSYSEFEKEGIHFIDLLKYLKTQFRLFNIYLVCLLYCYKIRQFWWNFLAKINMHEWSKYNQSKLFSITQNLILHQFLLKEVNLIKITFVLSHNEFCKMSVF